LVGRGLAARLAVCAVVGVVATVGVAWGIALWTVPPAPQAILVSQHPELQGTGHLWPCPVPRGWPAHPNVAFSGGSVVWRQEIARALGYSPQTVQVRLYRCGFPVPALGARRYSQWTGMMRAGPPPGITVPRWLGRNRDVGLPVRPVWPGFVVDAAVYGAGVFAAWSAVAFLHARGRRARGCCARCGYDMRGSAEGVCPECGA
jgi:hypothetical protein